MLPEKRLMHTSAEPLLSLSGKALQPDCSYTTALRRPGLGQRRNDPPPHSDSPTARSLLPASWAKLPQDRGAVDESGEQAEGLCGSSSPLANVSTTPANGCAASSASLRRCPTPPPSQLQRDARARVLRRLAQQREVVAASGESPVRVAVIGAGPVGLFVAVLLAREHARLSRTSTEVRISRQALAPYIRVLEQRTASGGYGSRRVVLAMSDASQDLLNRHLLSGREETSRHAFAPACSINLVESLLREEFERYARAGFGELRLGESIDAPESLLEDHDVVFVATGRSFPSDGWRESMGMQVITGRSDEALILKFQSAPGQGGSIADMQLSLARLEAKSQSSIFLRPGPTEESGWVWLLGLSTKVAANIKEAVSGAEAAQSFESFSNAWASLSGDARKSAKAAGLSSVFSELDRQLRPIRVSARLSAAAYWHSQDIVRRVQRPDGSVGWIVLVGDAACGKPFYLGSTLNGHFHDTYALKAAPWTDRKSVV